MRIRTLVLSVLAVGIAVGFLRVQFAEAAAISPLTRFFLTNAALLAALGPALAASRYSPGDYLRRAWLLLAASNVCVLQADLISWIVLTKAPSAPIAGLRDVLVVGANVLTPLAMISFALALKATGLDLVGDRRVRLAVVLVAGVATAALAGHNLVDDLPALLGGDLGKISAVASALGDAVTMFVLAPLLYNVYALRGGALRWPFLLLAASTFSWLLTDAVGISIELAGPGHSPLHAALGPATQLWGLLFVFAAGLAQRQLTRSAPAA
jgi:hypothetical protein